MQKKITDVLANLLRPNRDEGDDEYKAVLQSQQELQRQEEHAREAYKRLNWTRVATMQDPDAKTSRIWDLAADVVEDLQHMAEIDPDELPTLEPPFDPIAFQRSHDDPKIAAYKLTQEQLRQHGLVATKIRHLIQQKAD